MDGEGKEGGTARVRGGGGLGKKEGECMGGVRERGRDGEILKGERDGERMERGRDHLSN